MAVHAERHHRGLTDASQWSRGLAVVAGGALVNVAVAVVLSHRGGYLGVLVALLPLLVLGFGALVASDLRWVLGAALGLGLTFRYLNAPLPLPGGKRVFASDAVVVLALAAWTVKRMVDPRFRQASSGSRSPVFGWPLILFGCLTMVAILRGHERYGETLFGEPLRLVFYSGIAAAVLRLSARRAYTAIVVVFYGGAIWMLFNAAYYLATGTHQTDQVQLSTGGARTLSLSVAMLVSGSLFIALLNLSIHTSAKLRALDFAIAGISLVEIILAFGRTTFVADAIVLPLLCIGFRDTRRALLMALPLALPVLVVSGIIVLSAVPTLVPTLVERVSSTSSSDMNVRWREAAATAVLRQYHESPLTGVGFGRNATFTLDMSAVWGPGASQKVTVGQDPHDSYVYLLAGGGILLLSSFVLILLVYARDTWLRFRHARDKHERVVIIWAAATLFVLLVNALAGPVFSDPNSLLLIWAVITIPAIVPRPSTADRATMRTPFSPPAEGRVA